MFDRVAGDLSRIRSSPATNHDDLVDSAKHVFWDSNFIQCQVLVGIQTISQSIRNASRLLVDFLLHEGRPPTLGRAIRRKIDFIFLKGKRVSICTNDRYSGSAHDNQLVLPNFYRAICVLDKCQYIRAKEVLSLAQANNQWR